MKQACFLNISEEPYMPIQYRTRGNSDPQGKQKVYFTCHPDDFQKYFDEIVTKILSVCDCAVWYYTAGEKAKIEDLEEITLFVIPVTKKFLTEENPAFSRDYKFAEGKHIPILPIMVEKHIDALFQAKCGDRQYLDLYSEDDTAIPAQEKLKKLLDSVVLGDDTVKKIRAAFDAYVFLSYRKKDRKSAGELIRLIHKNPYFRDIAIWYDEYLTPGENFRDEISESLKKSDIFALVVTPSLLEKVNGRLNYVAEIEYPLARENDKKIIPVEMEKTDSEELSSMYAGIPKVVAKENEALLSDEMLKTLSSIALQNSDDPEHNFFIGLAYLKGIDVEVNTDRAVELLRDAAEHDLTEAMDQLIDMYGHGKNVAYDYTEVIRWRTRKYELSLQSLGEDHPDTLTILNNLAVAYSENGNYKKACELYEKCYEARVMVLGEDAQDTLITLSNLAAVYFKLGNFLKAKELEEKCYESSAHILGAEYHTTLVALNSLAMAYGKLGDHAKAIELFEKCYDLRLKTLGEEHSDTLLSLNGLAQEYGEAGNHVKALELHRKCYETRERVFGKDHPSTLVSLSNMATCYRYAGDNVKSLKLREKCYETWVKILGEKHPTTLTSLSNLALSYCYAGNYAKAITSYERCYEGQASVLGEGHPSALLALSNLSACYKNAGNKEKAIELARKSFETASKALGPDHPVTKRAEEILKGLL